MPSAHVDTFTAEHLPPPEQWPELIFEGPELQALAAREQLNAAVELLDGAIARGWGERPCVISDAVRWTYAELLAHSNRVAQVLVRDMGLVPGNRVLLRSPNTPMMAACWMGVVKAGGVVVPTMPLLRERELRVIIDKARISHALCDAALAEALSAAAEGTTLKQWKCFGAPGGDTLEAAMSHHHADFQAVNTAATDTAFLAFTSGTTGVPKATMHTHRDVMAACLCWPRLKRRSLSASTRRGMWPATWRTLRWTPLASHASFKPVMCSPSSPSARRLQMWSRCRATWPHPCAMPSARA